MIVDSHCHLNLYEEKERERVICDAFNASVKIMLTVCTKVAEFYELSILCGLYRDIYASVGIHPHEAHTEMHISVEDIIKLSMHKKVIAIGETGLDYYGTDTKKSEQISSFNKHIHVSQLTGLPLIIHSRSADSDMINILRTEHRRKEFPAVLHCFSSSKKLFYAALDLNMYISFSGIVTFKNAKEVYEVALETPEDRLLIETDAPFLAPVPKRGEKNQPAFINYTLEHLKKIRNNSEKLESSIENNFFTLFNKVDSKLYSNAYT